jgi:hypothetical protein
VTDGGEAEPVPGGAAGAWGARAVEGAAAAGGEAFPVGGRTLIRTGGGSAGPPTGDGVGTDVRGEVGAVFAGAAVGAVGRAGALGASGSPTKFG